MSVGSSYFSSTSSSSWATIFSTSGISGPSKPLFFNSSSLSIRSYFSNHDPASKLYLGMEGPAFYSASFSSSSSSSISTGKFSSYP